MGNKEIGSVFWWCKQQDSPVIRYDSKYHSYSNLSQRTGNTCMVFLILAAYYYLQHGGIINTNVQYCGSSSSSYFYWASVANALNVLQPYWLIVLPLDVPDLIASLLLWGPSGQRWRCLWTFLFSNVPTFATSRLQEILAAEGWTTWADKFCLKIPDFQVTFWGLLHAVNLRHGTDGFTSPLKEGVLRIFSSWKPANVGTKGQHATSRPPKPLLDEF